MVNRRCRKMVSLPHRRRTEKSGENLYRKGRSYFGFCSLIVLSILFISCKSLPSTSEPSGEILPVDDVFPLEEVPEPVENFPPENSETSDGTESKSDDGGEVVSPESIFPGGVTPDLETDGENIQPPLGSVDTVEEKNSGSGDDTSAESGIMDEPSLVFPAETDSDSSGLDRDGKVLPPVGELSEEKSGEKSPVDTTSGFGSSDENPGAGNSGVEAETVSGSVNQENPPFAPSEGLPEDNGKESPVAEQEQDPFYGMNDKDIPGIWEDSSPGVILLPETEDSVEPFRLKVSNGQKLEVRMPGTGWVYMGQKGTYGALDFKGKSSNEGDTLFLFDSKFPGTVDLEFSRFDVIRDSYDDRKITVEVNSDSFSESLVKWEESEIPPETVPDSAVDSVSPKEIVLGTDSGDTRLSADSSVADEPMLSLAPSNENVEESYKSLDAYSMLESMEKALEKGDIPLVQEIADYYPVVYSTDLDRMWYVLGQAYEADTEYRDIKKSLNAYETVVRAYPFSKYWAKSKDRIAYINRYYFNIR